MSKRKLFKGKSIMAAALLIIAGLISLYFLRHTISNANIGPEVDHATFPVKKGPLRINIIESGTIKARQQVVIKNEVEGRTSIIYLIPEGTRVKPGDLLVELDASKLLDEKIDQQIKVQNMEAAFVGARENLEVVRNQARADVDKARLEYDFAQEDLKKYKEGEYPNQLKEAESRLTLANEEVIRARDKLEWSKKLFREKYISEIEYEADKLTLKRKELDVELAKNNLILLKNFTHKRSVAQLQSDVHQAQMALERTIRKAKADVIQAEANLEAKKAEFERQKDKLEKIEVQIGKTKIYAPNEGLVVHATTESGGGRRRRVEPLEEGQDVRERQELVHLPTTSAALVETGIHEANLDKVRIGLPVKVTVDALPGEAFWGKVAKIAPMPDAQSAFLNPDLKIYKTEIYLDDNSEALRSGMSCKAEIIIEQHEEALYIPIQAVLRVAGKPTVYVVKNNNLEPRPVEIGLDNNRMIRIISGLEPGELVSLTPPLAAARTDPAEYSGAVKKEKIPPSETKSAAVIGDKRPGPAEKSRPENGAMGKAERPESSEAFSGEPDGERSRKKKKKGDQTPEQRERRRQFMQSLSPEEREKYQSMSQEEKRRFRRERMGN